MKHARRMLVCGIGRGSVPDLLIDDCEVAWTATTGLLRTVNATPTAGGSGYTAGDILDVTTGGAGGKVQVSTVDGGGAVTALATASYAGGSGYTTGTGKATSGGTGTGCTVNIATVGDSTPSASTAEVHDGTYSCRLGLLNVNLTNRSLLAHRTFATLDLSGFTSLRVWLFRSTSGVEGLHRICLCSDTAGRVVVDEFPLPAITSGAWAEAVVTRTGGGALGAAIQSVALYSVATSNTGNFYIDNIRVSA